MQNAEEVTAPWIDSSREGMREAGQVEGKTYVLDLYFARLDPVRSEALHRQAVAERPDVLVGGGLTAARLARSLTSSIPIVTATASDLVAAGVVASEVIR